MCDRSLQGLCKCDGGREMGLERWTGLNSPTALGAVFRNLGSIQWVGA